MVVGALLTHSAHMSRSLSVARWLSRAFRECRTRWLVGGHRYKGQESESGREGVDGDGPGIWA
jgi:hypothetical protein